MDQQDTVKDSFTIVRSAHIIDKIQTMHKLSTPIKVTPRKSAESFTSTISKLFIEKKLFALEMSENKTLNQVLQTEGCAQFSASVDGTLMNFDVSTIKPATLSGHPVFAVPLPKSIQGVQRRQFARFKIPRSSRMECAALLPGMHLVKFPVVDISESGCSVRDENAIIVRVLQPGYVFQGCRFNIPSSLANEPFTAEFCRTEEGVFDGIRCFNVGMRFVTVTPDFRTYLKDFLQELRQRQK